MRTDSIGTPSRSATIIANDGRVALPVRRRTDGRDDRAVLVDLDSTELLEQSRPR